MRREPKSSEGERTGEREAVRATIVGGRPSGGERGSHAADRGVEVLIKKAAVDPQFRALLLEKRAAAAETIGLVLGSHEAAMMNAVFEEQLAAAIANTEVPREHRRVFLGTAAAAMVAVLVGAREITGAQVGGGGFGGFAGPFSLQSTNRRTVIEVVSKKLDLKAGAVTPKSRLADLAKDGAKRETLRTALEDHFDVSLPDKEFDQFDTVEAVSGRIENSLEVKPQVLQLIARQSRVAKTEMRHDASLIDDLSIDRRQLARLRRDLGRQLRMHVDWERFKQFETVGEVVNYAGELAVRRKQTQQEKKTRP